MPWKECHVMDERLRIVARLLDGRGNGERIRHQAVTPKCRFANTRPEPDFKYFSNCTAALSVGNSIETTSDHGRWLTV
jgi:hypothetical protein